MHQDQVEMHSQSTQKNTRVVNVGFFFIIIIKAQLIIQDMEGLNIPFRKR